MSLQGHWEGKLLDAAGPAASVVLDLKDSRGDLSGDFSISFLPVDEEGCGSGVGRLAQTGAVAGQFVSKTGRVQFTYEVTLGLKPVSVTFEGAVVRADPHARRALLGSYAAARGADLLSLEGGACILWQYA